MARIPFEVEAAFTITGRGGVVMARWIGPEQFVGLEGATLGGCPIEPWTDIPRKLGPDGEPRLEVFVFVLCDPKDLARFSSGQRVDLETVQGTPQPPAV